MTDEIDLDAIEARVTAARDAMSGNNDEWIVFATRENWAAEENLFFGPDNVPPVGKVLEGIALAEFVSHAWLDVPALIAEIRRLRQETR